MTLRSLASAFRFVRQFAANPIQVGSVAPSTVWLADTMLKDLNFDDVRLLVEYGPGTGAFTKRLVARLPASVRYLAFEPNRVFREHLQRQYPSIEVIEDYAEKVGLHLNDDRGKVDLVVSGIPFSIIDWSIVEKTLNETYEILRPGGQFRTFIYHHALYLPNIRRMRELLSRQYASATVDSNIRNFPPAKVIRCVK